MGVRESVAEVAEGVMDGLGGDRVAEADAVSAGLAVTEGEGEPPEALRRGLRDRVCVGLPLPVGEATGLALREAVLEGLWLAVVMVHEARDAVLAEGVAVSVGVPEAVGENEGLGMGLCVGVAEEDAVAEAVWLRPTVGLRVGVREGEEEGEGVRLGLGGEGERVGDEVVVWLRVWLVLVDGVCVPLAVWLRVADGPGVGDRVLDGEGEGERDSVREWVLLRTWEAVAVHVALHVAVPVAEKVRLTVERVRVTKEAVEVAVGVREQERVERVKVRVSDWLAVREGEGVAAEGVSDMVVTVREGVLLDVGVGGEPVGTGVREGVGLRLRVRGAEGVGVSVGEAEGDALLESVRLDAERERDAELEGEGEPEREPVKCDGLRVEAVSVREDVGLGVRVPLHDAELLADREAVGEREAKALPLAVTEGLGVRVTERGRDGVALGLRERVWDGGLRLGDGEHAAVWEREGVAEQLPEAVAVDRVGDAGEAEAVRVDAVAEGDSDGRVPVRDAVPVGPEPEADGVAVRLRERDGVAEWLAVALRVTRGEAVVQVSDSVGLRERCCVALAVRVAVALGV